MLTGFSVSNFKNLAQVPETPGELLPFGPLNVFIGPNGCGKSSLLQAIDFLRAFFRSSVEVYLQERGWDYRDLPNLRQSSKAIRWELTATVDEDEDGQPGGEYRYLVVLQPRKQLSVTEERLAWQAANAPEPLLLVNRRGKYCSIYNHVSNELDHVYSSFFPSSMMSTWDDRKDGKRYRQALRFRAWVERFRSYLIWDPKVLRMPDRGRQEEMGPSGEHLAAVIGHLKDHNRPAFNRLVRRLRRFVPMLSDLSVSGRGWGWRTLNLHERNGKDVVFNSRQISDGILRLLAVTSLLYLDQIPNVVTFEEPENGVHPQLLREVVQVLRELTQRKPPNQCQIFLTTHSPYVLDEFFDHPDQVFCMERPSPQAGARIIRLSENRQLHLARQSFDQSLGEAWVSGLIGATAGRRDG